MYNNKYRLIVIIIFKKRLKIAMPEFANIESMQNQSGMHRLHQL